MPLLASTYPAGPTLPSHPSLSDLFDRDVGNDAALLLLAPDRNGDLRIHPKRISSCVSGIEAAVRKYRRNSGGSAWTRAFAWLVTCGASSRSTMR